MGISLFYALACFSTLYFFMALSNFIATASSVYKKDLMKESFVSSSVITTSTLCSRYDKSSIILLSNYLKLELFLFISFICSAVQWKFISPSNRSRFYKPNWFGMAKVGWGMFNSLSLFYFHWNENPYWTFCSQLATTRWMEMGFFLLATSHHLRLKLQEMIHGMNSKLWPVLLYV